MGTTKIRQPNKYCRSINLLCLIPILGVLGIGISLLTSNQTEYIKGCPIVSTDNENAIYICEIKEVRQGDNKFNNSVQLVTHSNNVLSNVVDSNDLLHNYVDTQTNLSIYLFKDNRLDMWFVKTVKISNQVKTITKNGKLAFTLHKDVQANTYLQLPAPYSSIKAKERMTAGVYCMNYEIINGEIINVIGFENTECSF